MTEDDFHRLLASAVTTVTGLPAVRQVSTEVPLEQVGVDSLSLFSVIMELEHAFGLTLDDEALVSADLKTTRDLFRLFSSALQTAALDDACICDRGRRQNPVPD